MSNEAKSPRTLGALAAFYLAGAYLVGMAYFLLVVDFPNVHDPLDKIALFAQHLRGLQLTYLAIYVVFGVVLVMLAWTLHTRLSISSPNTMRVATSIALIWAGVLIAGGMAKNLGMESVVALHADDPTRAATVWLGIETVAAGMTGANGELLGGLWTLLVSLAAWRARAFPRAIAALGLIAGAAGVVSTVPGVSVLVAGFGLTQLAWFVGVGIALLRPPRATAA